MSHDRGGNMDGGRVNIVVDSPSLAGKGARVVMSDDVGESGPWNDATGAPPPKPLLNSQPPLMQARPHPHMWPICPRLPSIRG